MAVAARSLVEEWMADSHLLSYAQWEAARSVLMGERKGGATVRLAAKAAGVPAWKLLLFIDRSREKRETDEPYVHEAHLVFDKREEINALLIEERLVENALAPRARVVVRRDGDGKVFEERTYKPHQSETAQKRLLEIYNKRFNPRAPGGRGGGPKHVGRVLEGDEARQAVLANKRLRELREKHGDPSRAAFTKSEPAPAQESPAGPSAAAADEWDEEF